MTALFAWVSQSVLRRFKACGFAILLPMSVAIAVSPISCSSKSADPPASSGSAGAADGGTHNGAGGASQGGSSGSRQPGAGGVLNAGGDYGAEGGASGEAGASGGTEPIIGGAAGSTNAGASGDGEACTFGGTTCQFYPSSTFSTATVVTACGAQGGTASAHCATANLVGCCVTNIGTSCLYSGTVAEGQIACGIGTWTSTAP